MKCPKIFWSQTNYHHWGHHSANSVRAIVESSRHSGPERRDYWTRNRFQNPIDSDTSDQNIRFLIPMVFLRFSCGFTMHVKYVPSTTCNRIHSACCRKYSNGNVRFGRTFDLQWWPMLAALSILHLNFDISINSSRFDLLLYSRPDMALSGFEAASV